MSEKREPTHCSRCGRKIRREWQWSGLYGQTIKNLGHGRTCPRHGLKADATRMGGSRG